MVINSAFWRTQAERFDALHDATSPLTDSKKAGRRLAHRVLAELQNDDPEVESFDFRAHDLRRTASTKMAEAGVAQADIARVLNHVDAGPTATKVYDRYSYDREKRVALEAWVRRLTAILERTAAGTVLPFGATGGA